MSRLLVWFGIRVDTKSYPPYLAEKLQLRLHYAAAAGGRVKQNLRWESWGGWERRSPHESFPFKPSGGRRYAFPPYAGC